MSEITYITTDEFNSFRQADEAVVLIFTTPTCNPCKMLKAQIIQEEVDLDTVKVRFVDATEEKILATAFNIRRAPTLVIYNSGVLEDKIEGVSFPSFLNVLDDVGG